MVKNGQPFLEFKESGGIELDVFKLRPSCNKDGKKIKKFIKKAGIK